MRFQDPRGKYFGVHFTGGIDTSFFYSSISLFFLWGDFKLLLFCGTFLQTCSICSGAMKNSSVPGQRKRAYSPPLPPGWSRWFDKTGRPYFINDEDGSTSWEDPRAPPEAILNQAVPQAPRAPRMVSHQRATPSFPSPPPNPRAPHPEIAKLYPP